MTYYHKQSAPLSLILYGLAAVFWVTGWLLRHEPAQPVLLSVVGLMVLGLGPCFHHLIIFDGGDHLVVRFGPFPLFQRRIRYVDIRELEIGRTTVLEGLGMHMSLRGGWVWNIWGRDCVVIHLQSGIIRVGTNDAENLVRFLESRILSPS